MGWLLNLVYLLLLVGLAPWLLYAAIRRGSRPLGLTEKLLGCVPRRAAAGECIWLHAASLGEVSLLVPLVRQLELHRPGVECVISTSRHTGHALAREKLAPRTVFYCPLDFTWSVRRAMRRVRPDLLVLTEAELWPNLIREARRHGAPVAVINARLSERSARRHARVPWLLRGVLQSLNLIAAQNEEYAARFRALGAAPPAIRVTGSIKFDQARTDSYNPQTGELASLAGIRAEDIVFLAGSTQQPEEELALETYRALAGEFPRLRLMITPRHPERFEAVARLLDRSGVAWQRRSGLDPRSAPARVLLVDTVGELSAWWGTAQIAFVGGSLGRRGGQNMIEPAACGAAVCFGPHTRNFRDAAALLVSGGGAEVVGTQAELTSFVRRCLEEPEFARRMGRRASELVRSQRGAAQRTAALLTGLLDAGEVEPRRQPEPALLGPLQH